MSFASTDAHAARPLELSSRQESLRHQVDVGDEEEAFAGVSTAALNVLLLGVETRLDAHLGLLMRTNWAGIDSVSVCVVAYSCEWIRSVLV